MWFQWNERGDGRRWWKQWPRNQSYDVSKSGKDQNAGLWEGDIRRFVNKPFEGYFKDIREIANRSIPKKNSMSLNINGGNFTDRTDISLAMSVCDTPASTVTLQKYQKFLTESFEPDLDSPKTMDKYKFPPVSSDRMLMSLKSERDYDVPKRPSGCTRVERFLVGTSLYLAIAVLIMLIVVTIMVLSLKDINKSINNINVDDSKEAVITTLQSPIISGSATSSPMTKIQQLTTSTSPFPITTLSKAADTSSSTTPRITLATTTTTPISSTTNKEATTRQHTITTTTSTSLFTTRTPTTTTKTNPTTTSLPTTTTPKPTTTTPKPTTTPELTTTTPIPTTTTPIPTTTTPTPQPKTTTLPPTTPDPTTTTPQPTTTTPQPTTTTPEPKTTTSKPTTTTPTPEPTTTTPKPTTTTPTPQPTTTTPKPTTTTPQPTTTTQQPTTTTPQPTTTTPKPTTTTPQPTTTTPKPTTTTPQPTTTTPKPTTTTPQPTTTTPQPKTTTPQLTTPKPITTTLESITTTPNIKTSLEPITTTENGTGDVLCDTTYCSSLAYNMNGYLNTTADKCSDFYEFACGSWITSRKEAIAAGIIDNWKTSVEEDRKIDFYLTIKDVLESPDSTEEAQFSKTLKQVYRTCLNEDSNFDSVQMMTELRLILSPLSFDTSLTTTKTLEELQYRAMYNYGASPLFRYSIVPSDNNGQTLNTLKLSPPSLYLKREVYDGPIDQTIDGLDYLNRVPNFLESLFGSGDNSGRFRRRRETSIRRLLQDYDDYGDYGEGSSIYTTARQKLLTTFDLERKLHQIIPIASINDGSSNILSLLFSELKVRYPSLNWDQVFPGVSGNTTVIISNPNYFYGMDKIITQTDSDTVKFYELVTIIFQGLWKYLPFDQRVFMDGLSHIRMYRYDGLRCVNFTFNLLNDELHREYAVKRSNEIGSTVDDVKAVITSLKNIMNIYSNYSAQISPDTKDSIKIILATLKVKTIPLPIIDTTFILRPSISFLLAAMECLKKGYMEDQDRLGKAAVSEVITWADLKSQYAIKSNTIELPLGLSSRTTTKDPIFPFLTSIGWELANNIIMALFGSMDLAVPVSWWSSFSSTAFYLNIWTCFANQLSSGASEESNVGNVMSGAGSLQLVLWEFERQILSGITERYILPNLSATPEQLFLLHFTQNFCEIPYHGATLSNKQRINSVLRNSEYFQFAYQCPSGTNMNPENKCSLL